MGGFITVNPLPHIGTFLAFTRVNFTPISLLSNVKVCLKFSHCVQIVRVTVTSLQHEFVWLVHGTVHVVLNCVRRYTPLLLFFFFLTLVYVLFIFPTFPLIFNIILSFPNSFLNFLLLFAISHFLETVKVKVKQSLYRPATGPEGPRRLTFSDFKTSAHEGSKVVSPMHQPPLPRRTTHFCLRLSRPHGHSAAGRIMAMKNL